MLEQPTRAGLYYAETPVSAHSPSPEDPKTRAGCIVDRTSICLGYLDRAALTDRNGHPGAPPRQPFDLGFPLSSLGRSRSAMDEDLGRRVENSNGGSG